MKVNYIKNISEFFETLKQCSGNVYLKSNDGTNIILNSTIGRFLVTAIFNNKKDSEIIGDLIIEADKSEDLGLIANFLLNQ